MMNGNNGLGKIAKKVYTAEQIAEFKAMAEKASGIEKSAAAVRTHLNNTDLHELAEKAGLERSAAPAKPIKTLQPTSSSASFDETTDSKTSDSFSSTPFARALWGVLTGQKAPEVSNNCTIN